MNLFGKEINVSIDKKKTKLLLIIGTIIGIIFFTFLFVISPMREVFDKKGELSKVEQEKISTEQNLKLFEKKYKKIEIERANQKFKLKNLLEEFREHSFKDEARLKQMIQDILDHLNIELLEIGKTETAELGKMESNNGYNKNTIPYKINGNGRDIALFFYYLENSRPLLTLKKSRLEVTAKSSNNNEKTGLLEVKFKLGYNDILDDNKGGNDEK